MLKHEFGIMPKAPKPGKRYDKYEPQKYDCISVDDAYLQEVTDRLIAIDFYWHTLSVRGRGLAYCGITLIPPDSLKVFADVVTDIPQLRELAELLKKAACESKWVIHFGI